jgi:hypothetical protein
MVTKFSCEMEQLKYDNTVLALQTQDLRSRLGGDSDSDADSGSKIPEK